MRFAGAIRQLIDVPKVAYSNRFSGGTLKACGRADVYLDRDANDVLYVLSELAPGGFGLVVRAAWL